MRATIKIGKKLPLITFEHLILEDRCAKNCSLYWNRVIYRAKTFSDYTVTLFPISHQLECVNIYVLPVQFKEQRNVGRVSSKNCFRINYMNFRVSSKLTTM